MVEGKGEKLQKNHLPTALYTPRFAVDSKFRERKEERFDLGTGRKELLEDWRSVMQWGRFKVKALSDFVSIL